MKRKRIKYLMRSRTLWIGCCIAAHMAIILWAIFAISKVWNAFYLVIHIVNIVLLIQICANDRLTSGFFSVLLFDMGQIFSSGKRHRSDKRKKWFLHGKGTAGTGGSRRNAISS